MLLKMFLKRNAFLGITNRPLCLIAWLFGLGYSTLLYPQTQQAHVTQLIDSFAANINSNPDKALKYIQQALSESQSLQDDFLLSRCYSNFSYYYCNVKTDLDKATYFAYKTIPLALKSNNHKGLSIVYNQLGLVNMDKCMYEKSLQYFLISLNIASKYNLIHIQSSVYNNLGLLYTYKRDTLKALSYYKTNEKIARDNDLKDNLLAIHINVGGLIRDKNRPLAIEHHLKAYKIAQELDDVNTQCDILINLGTIYIDEYDSQKTEKALNCIKKAEKLAKILNNKDKYFYIYFNLGGIYKSQKKYSESIKYYKKALALTQKGFNEEQKSRLYKAISGYYTEVGQYKEALGYQKKHYELQDSLFSVAKSKAFDDIITKYEVDKKNLKINLLSKEKVIESNKKRGFIGLACLLFLGIIVVIVFYRNRIRTQKIIRKNELILAEQEKKQLEKERELKHVLGIVEGQDQERNRIAKEIHDGVGGELAGIKLQLSSLQSKNPEVHLNETIHQIGKVFGELRAISHNLSSNYIANRTLENLLGELRESYQNRGVFQIAVYCFPDDILLELPSDVVHHLYRIFQELLTNIEKHALAQHVSLSITQHENHINIMIEDDGIGFVANGAKGIGIKNIEERLTSINGQMSIESVPGQGTCVIIDVFGVPNLNK